MNPKHTQQSNKELQTFGLTTGVMIVLIFGLALPWLFSRAIPTWPLIAAAILWSAALVLPATLRPVFRVWMTLGHWLGWINTRIILGVMFYTVFFIAGLALKLSGQDPMSRKLNKAAKSYRVPSRARPKDHVERPF
jgi:O-antigen/teichoic acid export membrane protein